MIRRVLALAVVAGGLTFLSACSTVDKPAATINGVEIPMSDFADEVKALESSELGQQGIGFVLDPDKTGFSSGEAARTWMRLRIFDVLIDQTVEASGEALPAEELAAMRADFAASDGWDRFSPQLQASILNIAVGGDPARDEDFLTDVRAAVGDADIDIASSIGEWDAEAQQVVPAGS